MPERVRIMEYAEIQQSTPEKEAPVNGQVSFPLKSEFLLTRCHRRVRVYLCDSLSFLYFYVVFSLLRLLKISSMRFIYEFWGNFIYPHFYIHYIFHFIKPGCKISCGNRRLQLIECISILLAKHILNMFSAYLGERISVSRVSFLSPMVQPLEVHLR